MAMKLYCGNLSYDVSEAQLTELFSPYGTVESAKIITDKYSGRSKGFGFVEMSTREEGEKAVNDLNGKDVDGRPITVNEARPQKPRQDRGGYGGGGRGRY